MRLFFFSGNQCPINTLCMKAAHKKYLGIKIQASVGNRTLLQGNSKNGIVLILLKRNASYEKVFEQTIETDKNESNTNDFVNKIKEYDENYIVLVITQGEFTFIYKY